MPDQEEVVNEAATVLYRQFALDTHDQDHLQRQAASLEELRQFLAGQVAHLLNRNPSLLMSILYRVDVAERDVKRVLTETEPAGIPMHLADLLIERQLAKIRTRRTYSSGHSE